MNNNNDGLFWYPAIHNIGWCDKFNKNEMISSYIRYYLARLQSMFQYDNLPETIPQKWLEHYLLTNGNCIIAKGKDDELYAFVGAHGTKINTYYIPQGYIVANPYFEAGLYPDSDNISGESKSTEFINGHDCCIIYNDTYSQGVIPLLRKYCSMLVENDITMTLADILARGTINISAGDDKTKASAELWLKRLRDGELGIMSETAFVEGLNVREFEHVADTLTNLIEFHQYVKASLYNELGLNSNYNMKRESINSNESQLNDDMLHPLIDNMLKERQEGIDRVNEMFGTDIKVRFAGAWESNEIEEQAALDSMIADTDTSVDISEEVSEGVLDEADAPSEPSEEEIIEDAESPEEEEIIEEDESDEEDDDDSEPPIAVVIPADETVDSLEDIIDEVEEVIEDIKIYKKDGEDDERADNT